MNTLNKIPILLEKEILAPGSIAEPKYNELEKQRLLDSIKALLIKRNAVLVAHYYVDREIQDLATVTGGIVSDSLEMARFGSRHPAQTLVVAGVRFMGETAKILNPEKTVIMPTLEAECSLDISAPIEEFSKFCDEYPDRTVVVYANTSVEVKARADWVVTSSNALEIINMLKARGEKIVWGPDKHLGRYIEKETGADMKIWDGACVVHEAFKAEALSNLKLKYPESAVLVHPESPLDVVNQANVVGSTSKLINAVETLPNKIFIVATDNGIFHKMKSVSHDKLLIEAPNAGIGATCESCAHCPWMAMNSLRNLESSLSTMRNEVIINETIRVEAEKSLKRMIDFGK